MSNDKFHTRDGWGYYENKRATEGIALKRVSDLHQLMTELAVSEYDLVQYRAQGYVTMSALERMVWRFDRNAAQSYCDMPSRVQMIMQRTRLPNIDTVYWLLDRIEKKLKLEELL